MKFEDYGELFTRISAVDRDALVNALKSYEATDMPDADRVRAALYDVITQVQGEQESVTALFMTSDNAVDKGEPCVGDVHVNAPMGSGKRRKKRPGAMKKAFSEFLSMFVDNDQDDDEDVPAGVHKKEPVEKGTGTYIRRDLMEASAGALRGWAEGSGVPFNRWSCLCVTVMSCPNTFKFEPDPSTLRVDLTGHSPELVTLDDGSLALKFDCPDLTARNGALVTAGAEWPFSEYVAYIVLAEARDGWGAITVPKVEYDTLPAAIFLEGEEIGPESDDEDEETEASEESIENYEKFSINVVIKSVDEDQRLVYGWASVAEENGVAVVDGEGDVIDIADMQIAAHQFNTDVRLGKMGHQGGKVSELVESVVFTKELQKALGIDLKKVGWLTCFKVLDDDVWAKVKSGDLPAFSIGGRAVREPIEE